MIECPRGWTGVRARGCSPTGECCLQDGLFRPWGLVTWASIVICLLQYVPGRDAKQHLPLDWHGDSCGKNEQYHKDESAPMETERPGNWLSSAFVATGAAVPAFLSVISVIIGNSSTQKVLVLPPIEQFPSVRPRSGQLVPDSRCGRATGLGFLSFLERFNQRFVAVGERSIRR